MLGVKHVIGLMDESNKAHASVPSAEEQHAIDGVAQASIIQCEGEGLSQAQLDCLLSVTEWANVGQITACDAIKAKHPSWLRGI